jgi:hypothetical protein
MRSREIEQYKRTLTLSDEQKETLVGLLLGDVCLETRNRGGTYRLKVEQSDAHADYVQHLYSVFRPWVLSPPRSRSYSDSQGREHISWSFQTVSHSAFRFFAHQFYGGQKKSVPALIHRWLTARGLAYWFMDDGSMKSEQSKGVILNTHSFSTADVSRLVQLLQSEFSLSASVRNQSEFQQIYISGHSLETFHRHVGLYLIDSMKYKLPVLR